MVNEPKFLIERVQTGVRMERRILADGRIFRRTVGLRCESWMTNSAARALRSKSGRIVIGDARTRSARRARAVARRPQSLVWSRSSPQPERDWNGIDVDPRPPRRLVAIAMQFAMMCATDGDRVFVADLSSERAGLGKTKMVRVGRRAAAHDAGLAGHESGMLLVAQAMVFACARGAIRPATNFTRR